MSKALVGLRVLHLLQVRDTQDDAACGAVRMRGGGVLTD